MSEEPEILDKEMEEAEVVGEEGPVVEEQGVVPESLQPGDLAARSVDEEEASDAAEERPEAELAVQESAAEEVDEAASEEPESDPELGEAATLEAEPVEEEASDAAEEQPGAELAVQESAAVEVDESASEEPESGHELGEAATLEAEPVEEEVSDAAEEQPGAELVVQESAAVEVDESAAEGAEPVEGEAPDAGDGQPEAEVAVQEIAAEEVDEPVDGAEETPAKQEGRYWYVIHSYSGYENKVKKNLESRIESMGMEDYIFEVVVPTEDVVELRDGRRRTVEQRVFPGYILVDMILNDESWFVVRNTPSVTGFVGSGNHPTPLRDEEADSILRRMEEDAPKVKVSFRIGDAVRIVDGPFTDFMGTVDDLNLERGKVRLLVSFFGRETPVELDFLQVETQ